ncbi:dethiobiotin synthase [Pseudoalteromonas fenneropenaei]|uniref:ATP-dependent dethiobiotin synthetase BioD n=1 Tax=Pseudoalteromonas fenneropenaei TaxID=1737459 RepID=A0ABV7CFI9_9GAMM
MSAFFITGTDTEVGKTHVTALLLKYLAHKQKPALGFKPIAAGAEMAFGQLVNVDALTLIEASTVHGQYEQINPFCFAAPVAPHIAAKREGKSLSVAMLHEAFREVKTLGADYTLVEGAGGWMIPLNEQQYFADWVFEAKLPVILVVGMKLGCLNHALLTLQAIEQSGAICVGWVANQVDPQMQEYDENLATLKQHLAVPMLAESPYSEGKPKLKVQPALHKVFNLL